MTFTPTPVDTSTPPIPMSSAVPDSTNTPLAVEGGPSKVTGGNTLVPVAVYQYDGYNETMGLKADAAITGDTSGSLSGKIRGFVKILTDVWDSVNHRLHVNVDAGTITANAGSGTFNNQQSNIQTDYDTGAGTQNVTMQGIALPASGGAVPGGTSTNPVRTDPTGATAQPVSGTVTANAGTNLNTSGLAVEAGGHLAAIDTAQGAQGDAVWSGSGNGSVVSVLKKIVAGQTGVATVIQSTGAAQGTSWRVAGDFAEVAGQGTGVVNAANTDFLPITDISAYRWFSVTIAGTWTATLTFQVSNDVTFTTSQTLVVQKSDAQIANFLSVSANGTYGQTLGWRYMRVRATAFTSNTSLAGIFEFYTTPPSPQVMGVTQLGTWTVQPGNTQNTTPWLVSAGPPADLTLLASGAQTTTQTLADQANFAGKGLRVTLDVTVAGTGSITLEIDAKDPASGKYIALLTGAAVTTISTNVYVIHPELTAAANSIAKDVLPHTWRVKITVNNANSMTYSVGASYLN